MNRKAIIIGSGIAGIASSIRLVLKGYDVAVFESNSYPGGKLSKIDLGDYRFDAGPSLFTLPEQVEELFLLAGKNPKEHFDYIKLPVTCHYFWEDGKKLKAYADLDLFAEEAHQQLGEPKSHIKEALINSSYIYEHLAPLFMHKSLHEWKTWTSPDAIKSYLKMGKLGIFSTMNEANEKLFDNPKLVQLFNRYATYNGSNPYETPGTLNIIPHLEFNIGAFFPKKGMHEITNSLFQLSLDLGVTYTFNQKVNEIIVEQGKATGVILADNKTINAEIVVNNMDMVNAYKTILKKQKQPKFLLNQPKSSSALIFYWGIKRKFDELDLHNIFFSDNYLEEFEHIFKKGTIYHDPTVYINITSIYKPDDAPKGCMNWFTMINVPNNQGQDWDQLILESKKNIIHKLNRILKTDIEPLIEVEEILHPRTIELKTSSAQGALYGNSSNNKFSAFLRHANYSSSIKNLYFCGGSVHPGGGIPLCLLSAKIMSEMIPDV